MQFVHTISNAIIDGNPLLNRYVAMIASQSQWDGRVPIASLPVDVLNPTPKIQQYEGGSWKNFDATAPPARFISEAKYGANLLFHSRLSDIRNETTYIVKKSRGGTSFTPTESVNWNINVRNNLYDDFVSRYNNTKNYVSVVEGKVMKPVYCGLAIGETDAFLAETNAEQYKIYVREFKQAVRTLTGNPNLPFMQLGLNVLIAGVNQTFVDAIFELGDEDENHYVIDTSDLTLLVGDSYHYDAPSTETISDRALVILEPLYEALP